MPGLLTRTQAEQSELVDVLIERYVCWREQCAAVQEAYDRWIAGEDSAFLIYRAELDFEEDAARAYRESAERVERAAAA